MPLLLAKDILVLGVCSRSMWEGEWVLLSIALYTDTDDASLRRDAPGHRHVFQKQPA